MIDWGATCIGGEIFKKHDVKPILNNEWTNTQNLEERLSLSRLNPKQALRKQQFFWLLITTRSNNSGNYVFKQSRLIVGNNPIVVP